MLANVLRFLTRWDALMLSLLVTACTAAGVAVVYLLPFASLTWRLPAVVSGLALVPFLLGATAGGPLAAALAARFGWRRPMLGLLGSAVAAAAVLGAGNGGALVGFRMGQTAGGSAAAPVAGIALVHGGVVGAFAVVGAAFAITLVLSELVARGPGAPCAAPPLTTRNIRGWSGAPTPDNPGYPAG